MRGSDFDFALDLLIQAEVQPQEIVSTGIKGLMITLEKKGKVAWIFDGEGEFLRFEGIIPVG